MNSEALLQSLRQTGRTHRMLQDVAAAAKEGRDCLVVCANKASRDRLIDRFRGMVVGAKPIVFFSDKRVRLEGSGQVYFSVWPDVKGLNQQVIDDYRVFYDHLVVEFHFREMLSSWLRYMPEAVRYPEKYEGEWTGD